LESEEEKGGGVEISEKYRYSFSHLPEIKQGGIDRKLKVLQQLVEMRFSLGTVATGILLRGISGTGKTRFMQKYSQTLQFPIFSINLGLESPKFMNELEDKLKELFKTALNSQPSLIFLDDLHEISLESNSTLTTLIKCISSIRLQDKVMILAAANEEVNKKLTQLG
jgi:SpoVK/Ycf46/Vps4 family AAA+-type ATPase